MAKELSSIVVHATRGPHSRGAAREILRRIRVIHERMNNKENMGRTVQFLLQTLQNNAGLIPEVQSFILILEYEYKIGIKYGQYD